MSLITAALATLLFCFAWGALLNRLFEFLNEDKNSILAIRLGGWIPIEKGIITAGGPGVRVFLPGDKKFDKKKPNENKHREYPAGARLDFKLQPIVAS